MGNAITPLRNPHAHSLFIMPGLARSSHPSSKLFDLIADGLKKMSDTDMKKNGEVVKLEKDTPKIKPDVTIETADDTFQQLADGKLNGQKAFMTGKLKVKGNIMLATKLDTVLKNAQSKL